MIGMGQIPVRFLGHDMLLQSEDELHGDGRRSVTIFVPVETTSQDDDGYILLTGHELRQLADPMDLMERRMEVSDGDDV